MCHHVIRQLEEEMLRQQGIAQGQGLGLAQGQGLGQQPHHNHHNQPHQQQQQQACPPADACNYLAACLRFLLCTLKHSNGGGGGGGIAGGGGVVTTASSSGSAVTPSPSPYASIVDDHHLSLDDRISFAATYLDDASVLAWLQVSSHTLLSNHPLTHPNKPSYNPP